MMGSASQELEHIYSVDPVPEPDEEDQCHEVHIDNLADQQSVLQDSAADDRGESDAESAGRDQDAGTSFAKMVNEITRSVGSACVERSWEVT